MNLVVVSILESAKTIVRTWVEFPLQMGTFKVVQRDVEALHLIKLSHPSFFVFFLILQTSTRKIRTCAFGYSAESRGTRFVSTRFTS